MSERHLDRSSTVDDADAHAPLCRGVVQPAVVVDGRQADLGVDSPEVGIVRRDATSESGVTAGSFHGVADHGAQTAAIGRHDHQRRAEVDDLDRAATLELPRRRASAGSAICPRSDTRNRAMGMVQDFKAALSGD